MKLLYGIEEIFWYMFSGLVVLYITGISAGLEYQYLRGELFTAIHDVVGYGIKYVSIFAIVIPSAVTALGAVLYIKNQVSVANTFIVLAPLLLFYFLPTIEQPFTTAPFEMAIIHLLVVYIVLRGVAPKIRISSSLLGSNCRPQFYPIELCGIILCAPLALVFFAGKSYQSLEFSLSSLIFGTLSLIFFITKKRGYKALEYLSVYLLAETVYAIYIYGPAVLEAGMNSASN